MRPHFKKSYLATLGILALTAQGIALVTLQMKSNLIDHLIQKDAPWRDLITLVVVFAVLQILGAGTNVLSENLNRFFSVAEFRRHWVLARPRNLRRSQIMNHHKLFNGLYNNIPKLFGLQVSITLQILTATVYACFFLGRLVHDQFWMGLLFIPVIGCFSWGAGHLYSRSYQEGSKKVAKDRVELSTWLEHWFRSARERTFNLSGPGDRTGLWYEEKGQQVASGILDHAKVVFKRDLFGSLLVDWPYVLCVTVVLINVVEGRLSIGEFLIWTTLIDHLMSVFASARFIKKCRLDKKAIQDQLDEDLGWLAENARQDQQIRHASATQELPTCGGLAAARTPACSFRLLSGETVRVGLDPGFYRLDGSNGSGKSTLMDTLIGFNDLYERWNPDDISFFQRISRFQTRVIERDGVLFPEWNRNLYTQIYTAQERETELKSQLVEKIRAETGEACAAFWLQKMEHLETLWALRPGSLSSGEKVILSFFRMVASLRTDVKVIAIDECDSVLDQATASMFQKTMLHMAQKYAIWYVSHTYHEPKETAVTPTPSLTRVAEAHGRPILMTPSGSANKMEKMSHSEFSLPGHSFLSSIYLLGFEREAKRGFVTPCQVAALIGGSGQIVGNGNVGKALADVLAVVKRAFVHTNENFRIFDHYDWQVDSVYQTSEVGEIKSAGLALALAMLNIARQIKGLPDLRGLAATGHILLDGSIVPVAHVDEKLQAARGLQFISEVVSFRDYEHISLLVQRFLTEVPHRAPLSYQLETSEISDSRSGS